MPEPKIKVEKFGDLASHWLCPSLSVVGLTTGTEIILNVCLKEYSSIYQPIPYLPQVKFMCDYHGQGFQHFSSYRGKDINHVKPETYLRIAPSIIDHMCYCVIHLDTLKGPLCTILFIATKLNASFPSMY